MYLLAGNFRYASHPVSRLPIECAGRQVTSAQGICWYQERQRRKDILYCSSVRQTVAGRGWFLRRLVYTVVLLQKLYN